ncbi:hypothetical protein BDK51DRAFT_17207, partial [Blyttiomyces helicus]
FGDDVGAASSGRFDSWALNTQRPRLLIALIILLDQFRRNMHRDTPEMYSQDAHCRTLVKRAIRSGVPKQLQPNEGVFLCLVLTHSEDLGDQMLCMELWREFTAQLRLDDPLNVFDEVFKRHVAVIQRFGRFPHRNEIMNRQSTREELEFLEDTTFRFDMPLKRDEATGQVRSRPRGRGSGQGLDIRSFVAG